MTVSLIGMLEQLNLTSILQRIETYEKTGALVIKQGIKWVELYVRGGRLICLGPVQRGVTLGDRLQQDGVISQQSLQEALFVIGGAELSETRIALTLMDLGYVGHDELRAWATKKAVELLQIVLHWSSGEVHFREEISPPSDRLLVAISLSYLLSSVSMVASAPQTTPRILPQSIPSSETLSQVQMQPTPVLPTLPANISDAPTPVSDVSNTPIFMSASQLLSDTTSSEMSFPSTEALSLSFAGAQDDSQPVSQPLPPVHSSPIVQFIPMVGPIAPKFIDVSFMQPDMILMPVDFSPVREKDQFAQLTPDQWRLLTQVNGRISLQAACQNLAMTPETVCQVAGELIAEGLIHLSSSASTQMHELSPSSQEFATSGFNYGYTSPGYAGTPIGPWSPVLPTSDVLPPLASSLPFETQSQWGNGRNGATFIPGHGWLASPQQMSPSGPLVPFGGSGIFASVGNGGN